MPPDRRPTLSIWWPTSAEARPGSLRAVCRSKRLPSLPNPAHARKELSESRGTSAAPRAMCGNVKGNQTGHHAGPHPGPACLPTDPAAAGRRRDVSFGRSVLGPAAEPVPVVNAGAALLVLLVAAAVESHAPRGATALPHSWIAAHYRHGASRGHRTWPGRTGRNESEEWVVHVCVQIPPEGMTPLSEVDGNVS